MPAYDTLFIRLWNWVRVGLPDANSVFITEPIPYLAEYLTTYINLASPEDDEYEDGGLKRYLRGLIVMLTRRRSC